MGFHPKTKWEQWDHEIQGKARCTRVHAEIQHLFQWNIFSGNKWNNFLISYISDNTKTSIFTVDGCHDRIFIWVTRFRHIHENSWWDICTQKNIGCNIYFVKLNKSLYGMKQSERIWHKRLKEFLLNKDYSSNDDCLYVFIRKSSTGFCIISVYVNDLNITSNWCTPTHTFNHTTSDKLLSWRIRF
jgi:hypothetical protein